MALALNNQRNFIMIKQTNKKEKKPNRPKFHSISVIKLEPTLSAWIDPISCGLRFLLYEIPMDYQNGTIH